MSAKPVADAAAPAPATISQRELRNSSGEILRAVAAGKSFVITNNGVPVAELRPRASVNEKPSITRPARRVDPFTVPTRRIDGDPQAILDDLKGDR